MEQPAPGNDASGGAAWAANKRRDPRWRTSLFTSVRGKHSQYFVHTRNYRSQNDHFLRYWLSRCQPPSTRAYQDLLEGPAGCTAGPSFLSPIRPGVFDGVRSARQGAAGNRGTARGGARTAKTLKRRCRGMTPDALQQRLTPFSGRPAARQGGCRWRELGSGA